MGKYLTHLEPVCTEKLEPVSHSAVARELHELRTFNRFVATTKVKTPDSLRRHAAGAALLRQRYAERFCEVFEEQGRKSQDPRISNPVIRKAFRLSRAGDFSSKPP